MRTKINLDVVFPLNMENDINKFEFFTQFGQVDEDFIVSIYVVPRYSIDGANVRNIKTSYELNRAMMSEEFIGILCLLKELQETVNDFTSTTEELNQKYYDSIHNYFHNFGIK